MTALLLLLLLAAGLTVRLAMLAGVTTATTGLLCTAYHLHCVGHVSVSGGEYYVAASADEVVGTLQVGQV